MSGGVFALVLLAALLHAAWNAVLKAGPDKLVDVALVSLACGVLALPAALWTGAPASAAWPYLAASLAIHLGYYATLAAAYERIDLSLAYPVMRGVAPAMVALASGAAIGEAPGAIGWAAVLTVTAGVLAMGAPALAVARGRRAVAQGLGIALLNAALIAAYTVTDALGVRASGDALAYAMGLFSLNGLAIGALALARRGPAALRAGIAGRAPRILAAAACSIGAYAIALWAMSRAPVALVAALRESSVLFAAWLGAALLGERLGRVRVAGTLLLLGGIALLRLAGTR